MNKTIFIMVSMSMLPISVSLANSDTVSQLLQQYQQEAGGSANAEQGRLLWQKTFAGNSEFPQRSCMSCHTRDLNARGKHIKTGKAIEPMSPSVNPQRLTDARKIEKWFRRNCKWTLGRECSAREKADFLVYINNSMRF